MSDESTRAPRGDDGERQPDLAPELFNDEQEDESAQAHSIADAALGDEDADGSPLDSIKVSGGIDVIEPSAQDLVDHMRDMEASGRIDMGAYAGEPNHDDNEDKFGAENKVDPHLTGDGDSVPDTSLNRR
ncbi:hypothetical protein EYB45_03565 [Erythrobacteraceae bacterium CFH 75059]|uniref:hypothetical protein n=1 Tax=Qipengyuania thermophila TaxID=2509361 RepID=UPI00101EBE01|nr:hypothetical protein [Qipengyuania thermophila]TCD06773.1 hypothetical protein EYB45_03565 [Erythrobacteraceae bacterium CFH 75059]